MIYGKKTIPVISGHKYFFGAQIRQSSDTFRLIFRNPGGAGALTSFKETQWKRCETFINVITGVPTGFAISVHGNGTSLANEWFEAQNVNVFDITQMFGSTIADYIYSLEQAHEGDGVAWFKALFGEDYYPYNAGELMSVKTSARKTYNADNVEIGSYALDDALTLRGIPKLDSSNELYYDGDTYASDGTVTRKYKEVTLNGDSTYTYQLNGQNPNANLCYINFGDKAYGKNNFASDRFVIASGTDESAGTMVGRTNSSGVEFRLPNTVEYTQVAYKAWFASNPTTVVYELATPTTESADAYTQSQRVGATEEFVDGRTVEIPVGNESEYKRLIQEEEP